MKIFIRCFLSLFIGLLLINYSLCQIPNGSFESWSGDNPVGWTTNNILGYLTPVTKSNIAHSGNFSARLEMMNSMLGLLQPVLNAGPLTVGIPVSQRHNKISFYYQFYPNSPSLNLTISVGMLKGSQLIGVAVGSTKQSKASFTKLTVSISYYNSQIPDAATIYITLIDSLFNPSGLGSYALIDDIYFDELTDIQAENINLNEFYLYQNYPNPFNPSTKISWQSPVSSHQIIRIYDILGNEIVTLVDEYKPAGIYEIEFNPAIYNKQPASRIYFYQLQAEDPAKGIRFIQTKKMVLLK